MTTWTEAADELAALRTDAYPSDVFLPLPPEFDYALLDRWLSDTFGFRIDRLSAEMYRRGIAVAEMHLRDRGEVESA